MDITQTLKCGKEIWWKINLPPPYPQPVFFFIVTSFFESYQRCSVGCVCVHWATPET